MQTVAELAAEHCRSDRQWLREHRIIAYRAYHAQAQAAEDKKFWAECLKLNDASIEAPKS
jgi:hypothetical protein